MELILMMVVFGLIFYFMLIRPQNKRMKEHQEMLSKIEPGTRVVLTSGIFATVLHTGDQQMIVELAPGVEVTVMKGHIAKVVGADDEEFEFADDDVAGAAPAGAFAADETFVGDTERGATDEELRQMFEGPDADERRDDDTNR